MTIHKVRGTRDIIPFDRYLQLYKILRSHLEFNHFKEIHTPYFEYAELFTKNLGTGTDIVNKEMYFLSHIHQENTDPKMVLRPELTASIMRAFLEESIQETPWKVFEIGPAFRHERPQKGRYREFFQCSIECINAKSIGYDLELVCLLYSLFKKLIPGNFQLQINYIGTALERKSYREALYNYCLTKKILLPQSIQDKLQEETILRILDSKDTVVQNMIINAPKISDFWSSNNQKDWNIITMGLADLNISFIHNERLIRGLDYYNGLIFEFTSTTLGAQNTFCGGGRYDGLANNINEKNDTPALGAGIGIDRLLLIMEENKKTTVINNTKFIAIIIETNLPQSAYSHSLTITHYCEKNNIRSKIYFDKESLKSGLKKANIENALLACIITDTQIQNNTLIIKEMQDGKKQIELSFHQALEYITQYNHNE